MMQRTQIYLPKTQIAKVKEIARKRETTASEVIRLLIFEALTPGRRNPKRTSETLIQAARRINKMGEKGPKDLAQNLDRYLYGKF
ncbi:ribbon-helix-helix protein, CopG family [Candidatus Uhrbacteria bacterium]|nr:ribbon-helix-helix protein, CopG family [Candidatus Uhrbacteria bacterium]